MTGILAVALAGAMVSLIALHTGRGSLSVWWGILPTANDPYLDNSGRTFQTVSWHFGDGTKTWGETYGVKVFRACVSVQVTHTNPRLTPSEVGEDR